MITGTKHTLKARRAIAKAMKKAIANKKRSIAQKKIAADRKAKGLPHTNGRPYKSVVAMLPSGAGLGKSHLMEALERPNKVHQLYAQIDALNSHEFDEVLNHVMRKATAASIKRMVEFHHRQLEDVRRQSDAVQLKNAFTVLTKVMAKAIDTASTGDYVLGKH